MKVLRKIGPGAVIGGNLAALVGLHFGQPPLVRLLEPLFEIGVALPEISGIAGAHFAELVGYAFGNTQAIFGVEPIMWVAEWVDISFRPRHLPSRNLQDL